MRSTRRLPVVDRSECMLKHQSVGNFIARMETRSRVRPWGASQSALLILQSYNSSMLSQLNADGHEIAR